MIYIGLGWEGGESPYRERCVLCNIIDYIFRLLAALQAKAIYIFNEFET